MRGEIRCCEGRLMRHDPQFDDPDLETYVGQCPDCEGDGCDTEAGDEMICSMGVGCDESGVCYAAAHGQPEQCPKNIGGSNDREG